MGVDVQVKDTGATGLEQRLRELAQAVTIGVHEDAEPYEDGMSVIEVGAIQEWGAEKLDGTIIPQRSFLRGWVDSGGESVIANVAASQTAKVVDGAAPDTVGEEVGEAAVKGVLARMSQGISGDPGGVRRDLDRTGHLRDSIAAKPGAE